MGLPVTLHQHTINKRLGIPIWTTRDGRDIPLDEMSDQHIANAIAVLIPWRRDCRKRREMVMVRTINETLSILRRERKRR
jgi:hypothetical protein